MVNFIKKKEIFGVKTEDVTNNIDLLKLLEKASRGIGEINNIVSNIFEFDFIVSALKNIESLNSAKIEGTTGNLKDLYLEKALDFEEKKRLKLFSAINYRVTMNEIEEILKEHKKIDLKLIRHLHHLLTANDPSTKGEPGKFREKEVVIQNSKLGDFFPANPLHVSEFMGEFVKGIDVMSGYPDLLKAAIFHYQFESIHPFEDGNGRTGRMLIVVNLLVDETLKSPVLNLSRYFDEKRDEYIASLRSVSDNLSYERWIKFFLEGVISQCSHNIELIERLRDLKKGDELTINEQFRTPVPIIILNHSLNTLYITIPSTVEALKESRLRGNLEQTARTNVKKLVDLGILEKTGKKLGRADIYVHSALQEMLMSS